MFQAVIQSKTVIVLKRHALLILTVFQNNAVTQLPVFLQKIKSLAEKLYALWTAEQGLLIADRDLADVLTENVWLR